MARFSMRTGAILKWLVCYSIYHQIHGQISSLQCINVQGSIIAQKKVSWGSNQEDLPVPRGNTRQGTVIQTIKENGAGFVCGC